MISTNTFFMTQDDCGLAAGKGVVTIASREVRSPR